MAKAFELEAILPDVAVGSVRLPRRQAGNSPQDSAVTLVADYTLFSRAWLPSAAIVALLVEVGLSAGNARTTISRLARRGVLESSQRGRHTAYRLTERAAVSLASGGTVIAGFTTQAESWDGQWTLVAFSLPHEEDGRRRALRGRLRWLGYAPLYDGLWVSPHELPPRKAAELAEISNAGYTVFQARDVAFPGVAGRRPLDAWDLPAIAREYLSYLDRWTPVLPRVAAGDVVGPAAVRARTDVMDSYRRFVVLDPRLPARLMPADWPRARARELFVAVYDGLREPAAAHVAATVAGFGGSAPAGLDGHTVAQLAAWVRPDPPAAAGDPAGGSRQPT